MCVCMCVCMHGFILVTLLTVVPTKRRTVHTDLCFSRILGAAHSTDGWARDKGGNSEASQEAAATVQARDEGGWEEGDSGGHGKRHLIWGCTLNLKFTRYTDG